MTRSTQERPGASSSTDARARHRFFHASIPPRLVSGTRWASPGAAPGETGRRQAIPQLWIAVSVRCRCVVAHDDACSAVSA